MSRFSRRHFNASTPGSANFPPNSGAFFVSTGIITQIAGSGTNYSVAAVNRVFLFPFFLVLDSISLTKISIDVAVIAAGASYNVGIYDFHGNKLIDSGPLSTSVAGVVSSNVNAILTKGFYYLAIACTSATPTIGGLVGVETGSTVNATLFSAINLFATNVLAGGLLPATLGVLTPNLNQPIIPSILFQS